MAETPSEFEGIFEPHPNRPVMSRPPRMVASRDFVREVQDMLDRNGGDDDDERVADWIADKMERFGARTARPVFTMDGAGPLCSWCDAIWPLCGHHHLSESLGGDEPDATP